MTRSMPYPLLSFWMILEEMHTKLTCHRKNFLFSFILAAYTLSWFNDNQAFLLRFIHYPHILHIRYHPRRMKMISVYRAHPILCIPRLRLELTVTLLFQYTMCVMFSCSWNIVCNHQTCPNHVVHSNHHHDPCNTFILPSLNMHTHTYISTIGKINRKLFEMPTNRQTSNNDLPSCSLLNTKENTWMIVPYITCHLG